ncbi:DUF294 nucleotidyltransferase-like domain-containing protein [Alkalihalobacillus oceani]|uniref:DUF294 nucleotidyltransferase-like domain-containing protein n=1 Tax=Halalkalibacter oceani TaxID=1653776 RepID=UPI002041403E|nr:DUF294 nucleotidyltransferase-like domain-containing protein [Halalkalibacter oceani]MCM3760001.1 DUF294 nucleotidyltransferase-like domain-containing protein [Halalkalibacter oceani]
MSEAKVFPMKQNEEWDECKQQLYQERLRQIHQQEHTSTSLQQSHEEIIVKAVSLALNRTESEWGRPPAHFAFFLMGSGGRLEQSFWSDQDHGIVFESENEEDQEYFLHLGKEIVNVLAAVGYERCDGKVMASHPRWCRSYASWKAQLRHWLNEDKWETLRHTLTFVDARPVHGEARLVKELKSFLFQEVKKNPNYLPRLTENTGRLRKGLGLFNQLLVETKGEHVGKFDLKQIVLFPYVNALRLLAIEEELFSSSTLGRFDELSSAFASVKELRSSFEQLMEKRLQWQKTTERYGDIHHLALNELNEEDKQLLKSWVKEGHQLYREIEKRYKKGGSAWS